MADLVKQLTELATMSPAQLRSEWRRVHRKPPPAITPDLLRRGIAYRLQELVHGALANCVYVGEVGHKREIFPGAHDAIVDRGTWDAVQNALADKAPARQRRANIKNPSLLAGLVYDGHGRPMAASHTVKVAKRYRYYMTREVEAGGPAAWRAPAHDLEQLVIARLCRHLAEARSPDHGSIGEQDDALQRARFRAAQLAEAPVLAQADLIAAIVRRIDIHRDRLELSLHAEAEQEPVVLIASGTLIRSGRETRLVAPGVQSGTAGRADEGLIRLVVNAHVARLAVADAGDLPLAQVAAAQGCTLHYFSQLARLGSLAPDIVTAILEGRQPAGLTRTRLARTKALPMDWSEQRSMFGFA